jgi:predicted DNA binding CopG/RHH family protein
MATKTKLLITGSRTTVRLPEELHHRAKMAAAWSGTKLQDFISNAVEQYLEAAEAAMSLAPASNRKMSR